MNILEQYLTYSSIFANGLATLFFALFTGIDIFSF